VTGISSYGLYIPFYRLSRAEIGRAWSMPALPGERAVANSDEDSLTMAVAAAEECLLGIDRSTVDGVYFASTTAPYVERQAATIIAAALDLGDRVFTADFTDSLRSATVALRAAHDTIQAGSAHSVLVLAADCRPAEPESAYEQILGDGAAAILLSPEAPTVMRGWHTVASGLLGTWRRPGDPYVRWFEPRADTEYGYVRTTAAAAKAVMEAEECTAQDLSTAVIAAPDPRSQLAAARQLSLDKGQLRDLLFTQVGNTGTALLPMMLAAALETAKAGDRMLITNFGDGADAFLLEVKADIPAEGRRSLEHYLSTKRLLPSYETYVRFRQLMARERWEPKSSVVTYWRDANMELPLYGARCRQCGTLQFPIPRVCAECRARDSMEPIPLSHKGTIYTYALDHLVGGDYLETPLPWVIVDLDSGGRLYLEMTDCDPGEVKIGMPVDLTFRCLHEGADFHNYYWKCRPATAR
jgi:hydroxymethylglutaryl-CoA synthase